MIFLKKDSFDVYSNCPSFTLYNKINNNTGRMIKKAKLRGGKYKFAYYICSKQSITRDDTYEFSDGELLGMSNQDLTIEDTEIEI